MNEQTRYIEKIKRQILACDGSLQGVHNINFLKILDYTRDKNQIIEELIIKGDIEQLLQLQEEKKSNEDLIVMNFFDSQGNEYFVTVYDNDQLWQDPQIIEIYPRSGARMDE